MSIKRTVSLTGINSSEIYSLSYPQSVLKFAEYDFSGFIRRCTDYCKRCAESGEYRLEDIVALRNSLGACHKYVEANIHGIYEKAVQDLFIEYLCREKGLGISSLWNELINAKTPFEKLIFTRLTEYRHNKAVNRWVSLLQLQEYAKRKIDFVFGEKVTAEQAFAKRDYFDLTFSVAANEMGYPSECFTAAKVYTVGRLPSAPFITSNISKAIAASALPEIEYEGEHRPFAALHSDSEAMDVFAKIKNYVAGLVAKVIELSRETEKWRDKYQQLKKDYNDLEKDADKVADLCNQLCDDVDKLEVISDKYKRALWIFGSDTIESAIWRDIQKEKALEEQKRKEQMPRKLSDRLQWGRERSREYNIQQKKNRNKHREMEL